MACSRVKGTFYFLILTILQFSGNLDVEDFRFPPRCGSSLRSSGMLCGVGSWLVANVSGGEKILVPSSRVKQSKKNFWPLKMVRIYCPSTPVTKYQPTSRNIPDFSAWFTLGNGTDVPKSLGPNSNLRRTWSQKSEYFISFSLDLRTTKVLFYTQRSFAGSRCLTNLLHLDVECQYLPYGIAASTSTR